MLKVYLDLTKFGIVIFAVISGLFGYVAGFRSEFTFQIQHLVDCLLGLYFLSSGSLALNQAQEWRLDQKMHRTSRRPIAAGKLTPMAGAILAFTFLIAGTYLLARCSVGAALVGLVSVILYNGFYTYHWKRRWAYAAVPGAIPGALPVTIGFISVNPDLWSVDSIYLFLIMFLWQMPHFWILTIKYKKDYEDGGVPVLPVVKGVEKTLEQILVYTLAYVGLAMAAPLFFPMGWMYLVVSIPISMKLLLELRKYHRSPTDPKSWLSFFMWVNLSVLAYMAVPLADRWGFLLNH